MANTHSTSITLTPDETIVTHGNGRAIGRTGGTAVTPIVIDLGKKKRKQIRDLKRGSGKLMEEVADVLNQVQGNLGPDADIKNLVPVVMLYSKKGKRRGGLLPLSF
jgi:hypothetical protein